MRLSSSTLGFLMKMEERAGRMKWVLFVMNTLFTVLGGCLLGFVIYSIKSMPATQNLFDGTFLFTYAAIGVSIFMVIAGIFGNFGSLTENICALKGYMVFMSMLIFLEVAVVIVTYIFRDMIPTIIESAWESFATETRALIQQDLKCCGFEDITEEYTILPESCYTTGDSTTGVLFQNTCDNEMTYWLQNNNPTWTGVLGAVAALQFVCGVLCCMMMTRINEKRRIEQDPSRKNVSIVPRPETPKKKSRQTRTLGKPIR